MSTLRNRREFLADVGRGMLVATVGHEIAGQLGLAAEVPDKPRKRCSNRAQHFGIRFRLRHDRRAPASAAAPAPNVARGGVHPRSGCDGQGESMNGTVKPCRPV